MVESSPVPSDSECFHVYKTGELTVIGFECDQLSNQGQNPICRDRLLRLVDNPDCRVLVVDLTGVGIITSWVLGILSAIQQAGVKVCLYHPTEDMRDLLDVTHLDELLELRGISILGNEEISPI